MPPRPTGILYPCHEERQEQQQEAKEPVVAPTRWLYEGKIQPVKHIGEKWDAQHRCREQDFVREMIDAANHTGTFNQSSGDPDRRISLPP